MGIWVGGTSRRGRVKGEEEGEVDMIKVLHTHE
jgi:hypothetical protein